MDELGPTLKHRALRVFGHQHWIRRGRDWLLRLVESPDGHESVPFEVDFFGLRYAGNLNSFVDWSVYYYGACARCELLLLGDLARALRSAGATRLVAADIGANVGQHTLFLAVVADEVYSFEPYPPVLQKMREKVEVNRLENVTICPVGLGLSDEMLEFFEPVTGNMGVGTFVKSSRLHGPILQIRNGDAAFAEFGIPPVDLMKVDVEGFEHNVFAGLRGRLEADRPIVLSELSDPTRSAVPSRSCFEELFPSFYNFVSVGAYSVSGRYRFEPFDYARTMEFLACPAEKWDIVKRL